MPAAKPAAPVTRADIEARMGANDAERVAIDAQIAELRARLTALNGERTALGQAHHQMLGDERAAARAS